MSEKERSNEQRGDSDGEDQKKLPAVSAGKRILLVTFGCQMNTKDSEIICGLLAEEGYCLAENPEDAEVVIFNTCSVRQHAEDKVWSAIGRLKGSGKIIGVAGCMGKSYQEAIFERAPDVDFVTGPSDIHKIPEIIGRLVKQDKGRKNKHTLHELKIWEAGDGPRPEEIYHAGFRQDKDHAYVVISEGCENFCSYCIVPFARGGLKNRTAARIIREIEEGIAAGVSSFTLLGQNVNAYNDGEVDFIGLLNKVGALSGLKQLSFITSHPKDTSVALFEAMSGLSVLKKYLHLPVQSGSDKVLKLMNRGYTRKMYLDLIDNYRKIVPRAVLTSDIIVGFPGETESDFRKSYELVESACFEAAFIFKYSPRPFTRAAQLADDVPKEEKERRHKAILDLQKSISRKKGKRE